MSEAPPQNPQLKPRSLEILRVSTQPNLSDRDEPVKISVRRSRESKGLAKRITEPCQGAAASEIERSDRAEQRQLTRSGTRGREVERKSKAGGSGEAEGG